jgi:hypothetical protein
MCRNTGPFLAYHAEGPGEHKERRAGAAPPRHPRTRRLYLTAFNAWATGQPISQLRCTPRDTVPTIAKAG